MPSSIVNLALLIAHVRMDSTTVGLMSDTHGVWDEVGRPAQGLRPLSSPATQSTTCQKQRLAKLLPQAVTVQFRGVAAIVHAGDIGPGAAAIIQHLAALAEVTAVGGNVDERDAEGSAFPAHALLELAGWRILVSHIVGLPPKGALRPCPCLHCSSLLPPCHTAHSRL